MKINKNKGTFIRLTEEDLIKMHILKKKHAINISALFRNLITDTYIKCESINLIR